MKAKNVSDFIGILYKYKDFINTLFEQEEYQTDIGNAYRMIKETIGGDVSFHFDRLIKNEIIEVIDNEVVVLNNELASVFSTRFKGNYYGNLIDYKILFGNIKEDMAMYEKNPDKIFLQGIQKRLRDIPRDLEKSIKEVQYLVNYSFQSAKTWEQKLVELNNYIERAKVLLEVGKYIGSELDAMDGFIKYLESKAQSFNHDKYLKHIKYYRKQSLDYISNVLPTLLKLTAIILKYIDKININAEFSKHLSELETLLEEDPFAFKKILEEFVDNHYRFVGVNNDFKEQTKISPEIDGDFLTKVIEKNGKLIEFAGKDEIFNEPIEIYNIEVEEIPDPIYLLNQYIQSNLDISFYDYLYSQIGDKVKDDTEMYNMYLYAVIAGWSDNKLLVYDNLDVEIGNHYCVSAYNLSLKEVK